MLAYLDDSIPLWLRTLANAIRDGLPQKEALLWPEQFLEACESGKDLDKCEPVIHIGILEACQFDRVQFPDVATAVDTVIALWRSNEPRTSEKWSAAESAAWSAAWNAASAAWSAESVASAESAEWSAWSAARSVASAESVASAAWSAWSAARSVASVKRSSSSAAWIRIRDLTLEAIRNA